MICVLSIVYFAQIKEMKNSTSERFLQVSMFKEIADKLRNYRLITDG